jgi:hypothetical protein
MGSNKRDFFLMAHKVVVNKDAVLEHQSRKVHVLPINGTTCISLFLQAVLAGKSRKQENTGNLILHQPTFFSR